uniref:SET domain-containing protein n=1 Tax=Neogobius melanostomus TaxID=47308 RepID=A0A8C6S5J6_9GOBI
MSRRRRISPKDDAIFYIKRERDKLGFDVAYINAFKGNLAWQLTEFIMLLNTKYMLCFNYAGRGIFATAPFCKGDFLLQYRGDLIRNGGKYLFLVICYQIFNTIITITYLVCSVDAAKEDNTYGRLVNDDCNIRFCLPCQNTMKCLNVDGKPHLCLFATKDISPGEEITYDYGPNDWPWRCRLKHN